MNQTADEIAKQIIDVVNQLSNEIATLQNHIAKLIEEREVWKTAYEAQATKLERLQAAQCNGLCAGCKATVGPSGVVRECQS